jgi:hypothetical protein
LFLEAAVLAAFGALFLAAGFAAFFFVAIVVYVVVGDAFALWVWMRAKDPLAAIRAGG